MRIIVFICNKSSVYYAFQHSLDFGADVTHDSLDNQKPSIKTYRLHNRKRSLKKGTLPTKTKQTNKQTKKKLW